jgi:hypothetical protein
MELEGTVSNGVVVLDPGAEVPDGTRVRIVVPKTAPSTVSPLGQRLLKLAGTANDLPSDMAALHDHYIHGMPKR